MRWDKGPAILAALVLAAPAPLAAQQVDPALTTRAERTDYVETSRLEDVQRFLEALSARSDLVRVGTFGTSEQGRPLLLVTLSSPAVARPEDARALGRPVVFVQANIHGGEVEGKEAMQILMRRLAFGDLRPLLDRLVVVIAPIYNVDGNEAIDVMNRTAQYGPVAGVGRRENVNGLDLNRDYMKLESAEARALVRAYTDWDPHLVVDLHTTNGSYHGYHLTYSIPLNLTLPAELLDYHRGRMMPEIERALLERHGYRSYYYGNFTNLAPAPGEPEQRVWFAFDHRPRAGQNYVGFRNRLTILSEAYSYLHFRDRVAVTEAFVEEILRYADAHGSEIMELTARLDREFVEAARGEGEMPIGVEFEIRPLPEPVPILVGAVRHEVNPRNGREMRVMLQDSITAVPMLDYAVFEPTRSVPMARAYVLPREPGMEVIVQKLLQHGIAVEELAEPLEAEVVTFTPSSLMKASRPFQGHHQVRLEGAYASERAVLPAGTFVVRLAQPLGRLASYLLEPESDDGLVNWNFFDAWLAPGRPVPVRKIMRNMEIRTRGASIATESR